VDKTDRPEVSHFVRPWLFWEEGYQGSIDSTESTTIKSRQGIEGVHDILFDDVPANHKKARREPVRPWALVQRHIFDDFPHFRLRELKPLSKK
jgi:hypothetical protein